MFCSSSTKGNGNLFCFGGGKEDDDDERIQLFNNYSNNNNGNEPFVLNYTHGMDNHHYNDSNGKVPGRKLIDEVIGNALNTLDFKDRQRQLNEQHGVFSDDDDPMENMTGLTHKLEQLEMELNAQLRTHMGGPFQWTQPETTPGIIIAQTLDKNFYSNSLPLRTRILRGEHWNAAKAAARMIRHYDLKKELFGPEKINKQITYQDLTADDLDALYKGFLQYLPGRDTVGRRIVAFFPPITEIKDPKTVPRLYFYYDTFVNANYKNDKGFVLLVMDVGEPTPDSNNYQNRLWFKAALLGNPENPSAIHMCFLPNNNHLLLTKAMLLMLPPDFRARIKIHFGSQTEWIYELMGFGIKQELIPLSNSGEIKMKNHLAFVEYRKKLGDFVARNPFSSPMDIIEIPNNDDVLFGRGRPCQNHSGNVRLQFLVEEYVSRYNAASNGKEKGQVLSDVIQEVRTRARQGSGRFLSQEINETNQFGLWMQVDTTVAKEKVSQMFRNTRRKKLISAAGATATASTAASSTTKTSNTTTTTTSITTTRTTATTTRIVSPVPTIDDAIGDGVEVFGVGNNKKTQLEEENSEQGSGCHSPGDCNRKRHNVSLSIKRPRQHMFAGRLFYDTNDDDEEE